MLNKPLKARIFLKYGSQFNFAQDLGLHEVTVSRIIRNRRQLSDEEKKRWAEKLDSKVEELFG